MRKILLSFVLLMMVVSVSAVRKVTFEELQNGGWEEWRGQQVQITTPLYVCGLYYDSLILAPERLYVPEEKAVGLAEGDSTMLRYWQNYNQNLRICLHTKYTPYNIYIGSRINHLQAMITSRGQMLTGHTPSFSVVKPSRKVPSVGNATFRICSTNIQNLFYDLGGYAQQKTTRGQFDVQVLKTATALTRIDADLYTICELEKGDRAPRALVKQMNAIWNRHHGKNEQDVYDFILTDTINGDTISVGFVYRKDKVTPYGPLLFAYTDRTNIYSRRFMIQGFEEKSSGERFVVSLNHPRSKHGEASVANWKRMNNIDSIQSCIRYAKENNVYGDEDWLILGDYNCYTYEQPIQTLMKDGYVDLVMRDDSLGYSYNFNGEQGYLDRAFASPSMAAQVTAVHPIHWNTDCYYSAGFKSKYNYRNNMIPQESVPDARKVLVGKARRNLILRYSDHDPLILGLRLGGK